MKSFLAKFVAAVALVAIGAAVPTVVLLNPWRWSWADRLAAKVKGEESAAPKEEVKQLWTCGMHPQVIQDHPGDCPICGMRLVPLGGRTGGPEVGATAGEEAESGIRVDQSFLQNFAVRTAAAQTGSIPVDIRTVGLLDYNQKNFALVNTKFDGWIERAAVNYVGEPVKKGQVLFEVYSPQLVTTEQEYLSAAEYVKKLAAGGDADAVRRARSLLEATKERLRYWDIGEDQIAELDRSGKITRTVKIVSPVTGVVAEKSGDSLEGMKLAPGMNVFKIANMGSVWAAVEVYEDQMRYMQVGRRADITVDAFPNRHWSGSVVYLDPSVNPQTRTLKAFVEVANPDGSLRPQMFANVEVKVPAVSGAVTVPEEAVLHSGERSVVIVEKSPGLFEPREVELGALGDGVREIRRGVSAGDTVVTSSQFLIDSESNLKEAIQKMLSDRTGE